MGVMSVASGTEMIDDRGHQFRLKWTAQARRDAAREINRGARVGVLIRWGLDGSVEWPGWAERPARGSTSEAEQWLERHEGEVGSNVQYTFWTSDDDAVLLAWDAC